jgi:hypothetical protein
MLTPPRRRRGTLNPKANKLSPKPTGRNKPQHPHTACLDGDGGLLVLVGREHLALLGGDDAVARDELGHHAAHGLDAHGQGAHIQQQDVLDLVATVAAQDAALRVVVCVGGVMGVVRWVCVEV